MVDQATVVVGLVLRRHTELAWKVALSALRGGLGQQGATSPRLDLGNGNVQVGGQRDSEAATLQAAFRLWIG